MGSPHHVDSLAPSASAGYDEPAISLSASQSNAATHSYPTLPKRIPPKQYISLERTSSTHSQAAHHNTLDNREWPASTHHRIETPRCPTVPSRPRRRGQ